MSAKIAIGFTVFNAPLRLRHLLHNLEVTGQRPADLGVQGFVMEDRSTDDISEQYRRLARGAGLPHVRLGVWGNMHGCARGAAEFAFRGLKADWFVYWPDDTLATPGAAKALVGFLMVRANIGAVGAVQAPYWNASELVDAGVLPHRDAMLDEAWWSRVPLNPHWEACDRRLYVNLNGAIFAVHRDAYYASGGFPTRTWCLDEHLGAAIWLKSPFGVLARGGPPFLHYFGASTINHPHPDAYAPSEQAWLDEWGKAKAEVGTWSRGAMRKFSQMTGIPDTSGEWTDEPGPCPICAKRHEPAEHIGGGS